MKKETEKKKIIFDVLICCLITFLVYVLSLNRSWIFYDERVIYDEDIAPILSSFSDIIEYIKTFGINFSFSSGNPLYTSKEIQRSNLMGVPFFLVLEFFFKKTAFLYHFLNLFIHLINTTIIYLILKKLFTINSSRIIIILLTTVWALHPAHAEAVLLTCNVLPLLNYTVYFLLFLDFLKNKEKNISKARFLLIPLLFLLPTIPNEHIFSLPLIILFYSLIINHKKKSLRFSIIQSSPYFVGLLLYVTYFLVTHSNSSNTNDSFSINLVLERIFWLSPQIFFHALKMVFFPKILSIDQSALITFGHSLNDSYSIFSIVFFLAWLILPIIFFLKNEKYTYFILFNWLFFISFLPFSQILSPSYCLFAERYLYSPFFFMVFSLAIFLNDLSSNRSKKVSIIVLFSIMLLFGVRTYIRTTDWKNNCTLIYSLLNSNPNLLYKGLRTYDLAFNCVKNESEKNKYLNDSSIHFENAIKKLREEKVIYGSNLPEIFKSYGLDYDFSRIKALVYIANKEFDLRTKDEQVYFALLERFKPYLNNIEFFDGKTLEMYANLLVKTHNTKEAKKVFLYAHKKYPNQPFIVVSLIRLERDFYNDIPAAKNYLIKALNLQPYSKEILLEAMKLYQRENNLQEYGKYSYLYGLRTNSKLAYQEALTVSLTLNDLIKSKKIIDKLIRIDKEDSSSLYLTSSYYIKIKDFEKAIQYLELAYKNLDSTDSNKKLSFNITNTLSKLYQAIGDIDRSTYFGIKAKSISK